MPAISVISTRREWTAGKLSEWYGQPKPALGAEDSSIAASILWALRGDAAQRALAAWSMGWKPALEASTPDWMVFYLVEQMFDDDYDAIRYIAHRSLRSHSGFSRLDFDHMNPGRYEQTVMRKVMQTWSSRKRLLPSTTLYDPEGRPRMDRIQKLKSQRDRKPITITE